jgi:hypothetical protein
MATIEFYMGSGALRPLATKRMPRAGDQSAAASINGLQPRSRLPPPPAPGIFSPAEGEGVMRWTAGMLLGVALLAAGCSGSDANKCPAPVHYDAATLKKIEKAREALPQDSVLRQVLTDYENERDDLRFCR